MRKKYYNFFTFNLIVLIFFTFSFCSFASENTSSLGNISDSNNTTAFSDISDKQDNLQIISDGAILIDKDTNTIIYEKNAYQQMYPASTTKLLTALVVLDHIQNLDEKAIVSYYAVKEIPTAYSVANLVPDEEISIKDLLLTLLVASANDSAYVLAQYVANNGNNYPTDSSEGSKIQFENSIANFANLMNEKAKNIGCKNSHFVNPNGIHNEAHLSTPYDLAQIGLNAYDNATIRQIVINKTCTLESTPEYTSAFSNPPVRTFNTTNLLMKNPSSSTYYEYCNGLKTGFTYQAGSCMIASASKNGRDLIAVVLHCFSDSVQNAREKDLINLFDYGFNNFEVKNIVNKGDIVSHISIQNGTDMTKELDVSSDSSETFLVRNTDNSDFSPKITITKSEAPIKQGEIVGTAQYTINGKPYSVNLLATHSVIKLDSEKYALIIMFCIFLMVTICGILSNSRSKKNTKKRKDYKNYYSKTNSKKKQTKNK